MEILSLIVSLVGLACSVTVLVNFSRNMQKDNRAKLEEQIQQKNAIKALETTVEALSRQVDARFDEIENRIDGLKASFEKRNAELTRLEWEHEQRMCAARSEGKKEWTGVK